jgi:hypothetical protein
VAIAEHVDAKRHRFARLIDPVRMIRRHHDGDAAEWLPDGLCPRRSHQTGDQQHHG